LQIMNLHGEGFKLVCWKVLNIPDFDKIKKFNFEFLSLSFLPTFANFFI
jgi:hypothetical protein